MGDSVQVRRFATDGCDVFELRFSDGGRAACDGDDYEALITIGDFDEGFCASSEIWSRDEYRAQWLRCAEVVLAEDGARSAAITSLYDPMTANWIIWWPIYRTGSEVAIYNQMCFLEGWERSSEVEDLYRLLAPEDELGQDRDGHQVSRWTTTLVEVETFAETLRAQIGQ